LRQSALGGCRFFRFVEKSYTRQISQIACFMRLLQAFSRAIKFDDANLLAQKYFYLSKNFTVNLKNRQRNILRH